MSWELQGKHAARFAVDRLAGIEPAEAMFRVFEKLGPGEGFSLGLPTNWLAKQFVKGRVVSGKPDVQFNICATPGTSVFRTGCIVTVRPNAKRLTPITLYNAPYRFVPWADHPNYDYAKQNAVRGVSRLAPAINALARIQGFRNGQLNSAQAAMSGLKNVMPPMPYKMVGVDYSAVEARLMAQYNVADIAATGAMWNVYDDERGWVAQPHLPANAPGFPPPPTKPANAPGLPSSYDQMWVIDDPLLAGQQPDARVVDNWWRDGIAAMARNIDGEIMVGHVNCRGATTIVIDSHDRDVNAPVTPTPTPVPQPPLGGL